MKRALLALAVLAALAAAGRRRGPSARQLHHQPLQPRRRLGRPRLRRCTCWISPRSRPSRRSRRPRSSCRRSRPASRSASTDAACPCGRSGMRSPSLPASPACARRGSNRSYRVVPASRRARTGSSTATSLPRPDRLEGDRRPAELGRARELGVRALDVRQRRAARVPEGSAVQPARRARSARPSSFPGAGPDRACRRRRARRSTRASRCTRAARAVSRASSRRRS